MLGAVILQVFLIFLNAIFASAEIAVISTNEAKLEKLAENGNKKAKKLIKLKGNSSKFLSTIQVAITLSGFLGSAYAADNFAGPLVGFLEKIGVPLPTETLTSICVFFITIILSYFSIVFGELVPKRVAMKHSESMALMLAGLLTFVSKAFAPFVWVLSKSTNAMLCLFRIDPNEEEEEVTEEDIRLMIDSGSEQGNIDIMEHEMIKNIFEFDDISVDEVCTHRRDVTFLYQEDSMEEWKNIINSTRHRYYPICGESADDIIAVLHAAKFFRESYRNAECAICEASEKPYFVPETMKADVLFTNMKETRNHFAIVIDEYGGTSGVITMHDLLELLVGDLGEKGDDYVVEIKKIDDSNWEIFGSASLKEVSEELDIDFDEDDYDTFGGYIFSLLDAIPDDGTQIDLETDDLIIRVETIEDHRVERSVVTKKNKH
jgi:putative hemolysin